MGNSLLRRNSCCALMEKKIMFISIIDGKINIEMPEFVSSGHWI